VNWQQLAQHFGYLGVFVGVGFEGVGIPLPGETVLLVAVVLAAGGTLNLGWIVAVAILAAAVVPNAGYFIGRRWGPPLLASRIGQRLYPPRHLARAERLFDRFGWGAVLLGRFVAVLRIFAGPLAGMHRMRWSTYAIANAAGAVLWVGAISAVGLLVGSNLSRAESLLADAGLIVIVLVIAVVVAALGVLLWRRSAGRRRGAG
jgi:membrane protein DedA with SNARE-associated domain